ncbi:MerR family transcriptional regulator [Paenibacillus terrigena]|uniref:MerR family transcriptional regulator n=1 Tax=Paenibacillus terrigena TaxID=369333 RepID=UPI000A070724|nr:MerR family transcriptional regulator [Paenibacillus terrigena]
MLVHRNPYYSIGQTAKICNISIQTLRYYDKIGLMKPSEIDRSSGYRYYSNLDILHIKIVQDMKSLDFSLEEIRYTLQSESLDRLMGLLKAKHEEALQEKLRLERITTSIEQRIKQIDALLELNSGTKDSEVLIELKELEDRYVAFDRKRSVCRMETSVLRFTELFGRIYENGMLPSGYIMTIYHENIMTFDRNDTDLEVAIPIKRVETNRSFTRVIPGGTYITALYTGIPTEQSYKCIYGKLLEWMAMNGYCESGPVVEKYLVDMTQMTKHEDYLIELQVPVNQKRLTL